MFVEDTEMVFNDFACCVAGKGDGVGDFTVIHIEQKKSKYKRRKEANER